MGHNWVYVWLPPVWNRVNWFTKISGGPGGFPFPWFRQPCLHICKVVLESQLATNLRGENIQSNILILEKHKSGKRNRNMIYIHLSKNSYICTWKISLSTSYYVRKITDIILFLNCNTIYEKYSIYIVMSLLLRFCHKWVLTSLHVW